ncbi:MAG: hypothetical protein Q9218_005474, partial [Villophora microphyllina]
ASVRPSARKTDVHRAGHKNQQADELTKLGQRLSASTAQNITTRIVSYPSARECNGDGE